MAVIVTARLAKCLCRFRLFQLRSKGFIADLHISPRFGNSAADGELVFGYQCLVAASATAVR